jgi:YD repeat-containing protein
VWTTDDDVNFQLVESPSGFAVTLTNGDVETYSLDGRLLTKTTASGRTTTYSYNANDQLVRITNVFGQSLNFSYDTNGHVGSITDPSGQIYQYSYDTNDNLIGVSFPDGAVRYYHYENVEFPSHLTGITDERGVRYATFSYDEEGLAISTGHAETDNGAPQEKFILEYQEAAQ